MITYLNVAINLNISTWNQIITYQNLIQLWFAMLYEIRSPFPFKYNGFVQKSILILLFRHAYNKANCMGKRISTQMHVHDTSYN